MNIDRVKRQIQERSILGLSKTKTVISIIECNKQVIPLQSQREYMVATVVKDSNTYVYVGSKSKAKDIKKISDILWLYCYTQSINFEELLQYKVNKASFYSFTVL